MKNQVSQRLLQWYHQNKRDLPWRQTKDPYKILVSEIMLQQTRVETVIPYFLRFINAFPNIQTLANVEDDVLMKYWQGLGYYRRASNLKKAMQQCVEYYDGSMPLNKAELLKLTGIGDYTAGAVASIAFNEQCSAIDGNVCRVYSRLYHIEDDITKLATKRYIDELIQREYNDQMGDFNQALMDLGSQICISKGIPKCEICPLKDICEAKQKNIQMTLPYKPKAKPKKIQQYSVIIYKHQNQVLVTKRPSDGLLASLYEFYIVDEFVKDKLVDYTYLDKYKHIFTHMIWEMEGFLIEVDEKIERPNFQWVEISKLDTTYCIPTAYQPFLKRLKENIAYE